MKVKFLLPGMPLRTRAHDSSLGAADLEAGLWLWEAEHGSSLLSVFASTPALVGGGALMEARGKGSAAPC